MMLRIGNIALGSWLLALGKKKKAFTLVEMLVVLAIVAMLLGISVPFTSMFGKGLSLKTSARGISGALRVAKSNAITYRKKYVVVFDVEDSSYWIENNDGKMFDKKYRLSKTIKFKVPDDEEADPVTFEEDKVIFYSSGAAGGNSGSATISDKRGNSKTISIIGSTGKITID